MGTTRSDEAASAAGVRKREVTDRGAKLYSARTIKVKDEDDIRTYYFYEFGLDKEHVAVMATVNSGKTYIAGATAPETKWDDDGVKLRSAAVSLSVS
ncbi:hypothetical protein GUJ93_ZPchr0010g10375 [Zizania palustris]|uniref:PsbP C-terminal domain-containing protein n=1 Tax=Zizania palustris TaxID=103762 RepID=A0A8J6BCD5_ZIZPA|nr:hypothetical protein GUJ93_ZPchr0010g10375 [Zizania palustris]